MSQVHRFGRQFSDGKVPEAKLVVELHSVHVELDPTLLDRLNVINKLPSFSRQSSSPDSFEKDARSLYLPMSNANMVSFVHVTYICVYVSMYFMHVCVHVCVCMCECVNSLHKMYCDDLIVAQTRLF